MYSLLFVHITNTYTHQAIAFGERERERERDIFLYPLCMANVYIDRCWRGRKKSVSEVSARATERNGEKREKSAPYAQVFNWIIHKSHMKRIHCAVRVYKYIAYYIATRRCVCVRAWANARRFSDKPSRKIPKPCTSIHPYLHSRADTHTLPLRQTKQYQWWYGFYFCFSFSHLVYSLGL